VPHEEEGTLPGMSGPAISWSVAFTLKLIIRS
jgi:hypothetical protein